MGHTAERAQDGARALLLAAGLPRHIGRPRLARQGADDLLVGLPSQRIASALGIGPAWWNRAGPPPSTPSVLVAPFGASRASQWAARRRLQWRTRAVTVISSITNQSAKSSCLGQTQASRRRRF